MYKGSRDIIGFASKIVVIIAVINGLVILALFAAGDLLSGLVLGIMLGLELWVFFKLLYSYELVIIEVLAHDQKIDTLEEKVMRLETALPEGRITPDGTKQLNKKSMPVMPLEQKILPEPEQPPLKGFIYCRNPYCREMQVDNRSVCWKCGMKLTE